MGLAVYSFLTTWKKSRSIGIAGIFFTYFVGSFGYIVLAIQGRGFFGGETTFWAAQGNTIIGNPPHAICYFFLPAFFLSFHYFLKEKNTWSMFVCLLLGGFLAGFKISAGTILIAGLVMATLYSLIAKKRKDLAFLTLVIFFLNFVTFKFITKKGESLLMFLPWWFIPE